MTKCSAVAIGVLVVGFTSAHLCAAGFDILGLIGVPYGEKPVLVSHHGSVVLAIPGAALDRDGFLWTASEGIVHRFSAIAHSKPLGLSGNGQLVVGTEGGSDYAVPTIYKYDASLDGRVVVGYQSFGYPVGEAFRNGYGEPPMLLGKLPGDQFSAASAVSADGNTVVGSGGGIGWSQPFRWTAEEGMVSLGTLPGAPRLGGKARDVSGDGTVIVGDLNSPHGVHEAFRWSPLTGLQGLGDLPEGGFESSAYGISADGRFIVGRGLSASNSRAFIWDDIHGMRNLADVLQNEFGFDLQGVTLQAATSISADGRVIVGFGTKAIGPGIDTVAWRVVIFEPSTSTLVSVMMIPISGIAYQKHRTRRLGSTARRPNSKRGNTCSHPEHNS